MSNDAMTVADLAAFLEKHGAQVVKDEDGETIGLAMAGGRMTAIRWSPGTRSVLLAVPTGVVVPVAMFAATLLELAKINDALEAPGFTLDLDDGTIEYRARLVSTARGALDLEVFDGTLRAALSCVDKTLPRLRAAASRSRHSMVRNAATAFAGYVE